MRCSKTSAQRRQENENVRCSGNRQTIKITYTRYEHVMYSQPSSVLGARQQKAHVSKSALPQMPLDKLNTEQERLVATVACPTLQMLSQSTQRCELLPPPSICFDPLRVHRKEITRAVVDLLAVR